MATFAGATMSDTDALRLRGIVTGSWQSTQQLRTEADEAPDEMVDALIWALAEFAGEHDEGRAAFNEAKHPRNPKGSVGGGRFKSIADRVIDALKQHHAGKGDGDPLKDFNREQVRKVAKARGIELKRGASEADIKKALIDHAAPGKGKTPPVVATAKKANPVSPPPAPPAGAGVKKKNDDSIAKLQQRIAELSDEAKPIADEIARRLESRKIHTANEDLAYYKRLEQLKKLGEHGSKAAQDLLDELIARDGEPWGGDPHEGADRWAPPSVGYGTFAGVLEANGMTDMAALQRIHKIRDNYVVNDRNTILKNAELRSGEPSPAATRWAKQMSEMVRSSEFTHDTLVFRGAAMRPEQVMALRPGSIMHDRGFASTAVDADEAETYANTRVRRMPGTVKTMFQIRAPKGSSGTRVGYGEVVLDRGGHFRIISSRRADDGVVHVVMELVGGTP